MNSRKRRWNINMWETITRNSVEMKKKAGSKKKGREIAAITNDGQEFSGK